MQNYNAENSSLSLGVKSNNKDARPTKQIPGNTMFLKVDFTNTTFSIPINFRRLKNGDAESSKLGGHLYTTRAAIRTLRVPAKKFQVCTAANSMLAKHNQASGMVQPKANEEK